MTDLTGQVVVVTGANGGLGTAVTEAFTLANAVVYGVARHWEDTDSACAGFTPVRADLTTEEGASKAIRRALDETGRLDVLVHLVGGFAGGQPVAETPAATLESMLAINLKSAWLTIRAALPAMQGAGRGRILAIGSRPGLDPSPGLAAYSVSKAALHALIQSVAAEVKGSGITANAVLPSVIDTPGNRAAMPDADPAAWVTPRSIARLLLWLACEASGDVNGALIPIYGKA